MWWVVVPCANRKSLRTESRKDIEETLKTKLATIKEELETCDDNRSLSNHLCVAKKGKNIDSKAKTVPCFRYASIQTQRLLPPPVHEQSRSQRSPGWSSSTIA